MLFPGLIRQVCEGLLYVHSRNVVHRDLRPENIVITKDGVVKLVNFDLARVESDEMGTIGTQAARLLNPRYAAPEVTLDASAASPLSDQFSAGIILFELLTGQLPYRNNRDFFQARSLPHLPSQLDATLPRDVDQVIARMCAFQAGDRYASMTEVIEDLAIIG